LILSHSALATPAGDRVCHSSMRHLDRDKEAICQTVFSSAIRAFDTFLSGKPDHTAEEVVRSLMQSLGASNRRRAEVEKSIEASSMKPEDSGLSI